jgi:actin-related protein 8
LAPKLSWSCGCSVSNDLSLTPSTFRPLYRILLNVGGNDITEFLYVLFERIGFPYRDLDLARSYDWNVMEDLKSRITTLDEVRYFSSALPPPLEPSTIVVAGISSDQSKKTKQTLTRSFPFMGHLKGDVALNLYDFIVRRPGAPAEKYGLRAYDEIILAPMVSLSLPPSPF